MIISEIYKCLQGEGRLAGVPSILIRTSTCNLRCGWIDPVTKVMSKCDTPFTSWNPEINKMDPETINKSVVDMALPHGIRHVIISGGEPTIQPELSQLCSLLKQEGFHITIESNGTTDYNGPVDLFSISPKLSNSVPVGTEFESMHAKARMKINVLKKLTSSYDSYLKFVCNSEADLVEIKGIQLALSLPSDRIYLMPEGQTNEELQARRLWLADRCLDNGYRYTDRMHIILYGKKRGV